MAALRQRLRLWVVAWLLFQVASLSAFVPGDCCAAHRPAGASPSSSHAHGAADSHAAQCPMRGPDGAPCPMHAAGAQVGQSDTHHGASHHAVAAEQDQAPSPHGKTHGHGHADPTLPSEACSMRGACDGPMAALAVLLSHVCPLADTFVLAPALAADAATRPASEHLIRRLAAPDSPPPRA